METDLRDVRVEQGDKPQEEGGECYCNDLSERL